MKQVKYAVVHQAISALHSVVCIPDYYWGQGSPEPEKGMKFELKPSREKDDDKWFPQPSRWQIDGPVWKITQPLDPGCVSFFTALWPFDDWIDKTEDYLYCFRAKLLEPELEITNLAEKVGLELAKRELRVIKAG